MAGLSLLAKTDADPCPRVEITIDGLHATDESTVTVWRTAGGQRMKVRGLDELVVTAATFVVDFECPLGRVVDYELVVEGTTIPATLTASVTVDSDYAWLQDPLAPAACSPLTAVRDSSSVPFLGPDSLTSASHPLAAEIAYPLGASLGVARGGSRRAATRIPFDVFCETQAASLLVRSILDQAFPVLLRPLADWPTLLPVSFLSVADVDAFPLDNWLGGTMHQWSLVGDLVAGPSVNIVVPIWTYGDVSALWATYGDVAATGRTYLEMLQDPEP